MTSRAFRPLADDIFIASYPRSGTTWLQMIVYQLLRPGEAFEHISQVIPFIDRAIRNGGSFDDLPSPRIFKTHLRYRNVAGWTGRWIYLARDGRDVAVSYFNFYRSYLDLREPFDVFFERFLRGDVLYGSWLAHVAEWRSRASDRSTLLLTYEQLATDFDAAVARLASFLGVDTTPDIMCSLRMRCSFTSMRADESKFDPVTERSLDASVAVQAAVPSGSFVRQGQVGAWTRVLSPDQARRFGECMKGLPNSPLSRDMEA